MGTLRFFEKGLEIGSGLCFGEMKVVTGQAWSGRGRQERRERGVWTHGEGSRCRRAAWRQPRVWPGLAEEGADSGQAVAAREVPHGSRSRGLQEAHAKGTGHKEHSSQG